MATFQELRTKLNVKHGDLLKGYGIISGDFFKHTGKIQALLVALDEKRRANGQTNNTEYLEQILKDQVNAASGFADPNQKALQVASSLSAFATQEGVDASAIATAQNKVDNFNLAKTDPDWSNKGLRIAHIHGIVDRGVAVAKDTIIPIHYFIRSQFGINPPDAQDAETQLKSQFKKLFGDEPSFAKDMFPAIQKVLRLAAGHTATPLTKADAKLIQDGLNSSLQALESFIAALPAGDPKESAWKAYRADFAELNDYIKPLTSQITLNATPITITPAMARNVPILNYQALALDLLYKDNTDVVKILKSLRKAYGVPSGGNLFMPEAASAYLPFLAAYFQEDPATSRRPRWLGGDGKGVVFKGIDDKEYFIAPDRIEFKDNNKTFDPQDAFEMALFAASNPAMRGVSVQLTGTDEQRYLLMRACEAVGLTVDPSTKPSADFKPADSGYESLWNGFKAQADAQVAGAAPTPVGMAAAQAKRADVAMAELEKLYAPTKAALDRVTNATTPDEFKDAVAEAEAAFTKLSTDKMWTGVVVLGAKGLPDLVREGLAVVPNTAREQFLNEITQTPQKISDIKSDITEIEDLSRKQKAANDAINDIKKFEDVRTEELDQIEILLKKGKIDQAGTALDAYRTKYLGTPGIDDVYTAKKGIATSFTSTSVNLAATNIQDYFTGEITRISDTFDDSSISPGPLFRRQEKISNRAGQLIQTHARRAADIQLKQDWDKIEKEFISLEADLKKKGGLIFGSASPLRQQFAALDKILNTASFEDQSQKDKAEEQARKIANEGIVDISLSKLRAVRDMLLKHQHAYTIPNNTTPSQPDYNDMSDFRHHLAGRFVAAHKAFEVAGILEKVPPKGSSYLEPVDVEDLIQAKPVTPKPNP